MDTHKVSEAVQRHHRLVAVATKAVEVEEHDSLERACFGVHHHALEFRPAREQRTAHTIVAVDVSLVERPSLRGDERLRAINLPRDRLLFLCHVILVIALTRVDSRNHRILLLSS